MEFDLHTYSVGGDSSINRIARFIEDVKTTGRSHNRIMIVEVFGRYAGHTTLLGGLAGDADCILVPEIPVDFDVVYEHMRERFQRRVSASPYKSGTYVIAVSEGFTDASQQRLSDQTLGADAFGHKKLGGTGKYVRQQLSEHEKRCFNARLHEAARSVRRADECLAGNQGSFAVLPFPIGPGQRRGRMLRQERRRGGAGGNRERNERRDHHGRRWGRGAVRLRPHKSSASAWCRRRRLRFARGWGFASGARAVSKNLSSPSSKRSTGIIFKRHCDGASQIQTTRFR